MPNAKTASSPFGIWHLLNDRRRSHSNFYLPYGGGQLKRFVHIDSGRRLGRAGVEGQELLEERLRDGDPGDLGGFQREPSDALLRRQGTGRGDGQPSRQVTQRIGPRAFFLR